MLVFQYFYDKMNLLRGAINKKQSTEEATQAPVAPLIQANVSPSAALAVAPSTATVDLTRSLILSISVCYHARLNDREEFEEEIAHEFTAPLTLSGGADQFRNEIRWYVRFSGFSVLVNAYNECCVLCNTNQVPGGVAREHGVG